MVLTMAAGCSNSSDPAPSNSGSELGKDPVTIVFWHSMQDKAGAQLDALVKEFNEGPGKELQITVEAIYQGKYSDSVTKMNSVLTSNNKNDLPDVMNLDATGKVSYASSDAAYTMDDALKADADYDTSKILKAALGNWNYAGVQLGMPFATSTSVTYYNKTMLDAAGVTSAPSTFADISALVAKIPETTSDNKKIVALQGSPNTPSLANYIGQLGGYVVDKKNGSEGSATKLTCVEDGTLSKFLTAWKAMYDAGALEVTDPDTDAFVAGQVAVLTTSSSNIETLIGKIDGKFELGVSNYIRVDDSATEGATISGSCLVMFDKDDSLKKAASWEFVKFMASAESQAKFAVATGYVPCNSGAADVQEYIDLLDEYPQFAVPAAQIAATPDTMISVTVGPSMDFYYAIQNNVSDMLTNNLTVEKTIENMVEELNGLLDQYNMANPS